MNKVKLADFIYTSQQYARTRISEEEAQELAEDICNRDEYKSLLTTGLSKEELETKVYDELVYPEFRKRDPDIDVPFGADEPCWKPPESHLAT